VKAGATAWARLGWRVRDSSRQVAKIRVEARNRDPAFGAGSRCFLLGARANGEIPTGCPGRESRRFEASPCRAAPEGHNPPSSTQHRIKGLYLHRAPSAFGTHTNDLGEKITRPRTGLLPGQTLWAWMDLNHRPLPYQGSALTELSYRPMRADKSDRHAELGYRKPRPGVQSVSLSVTSIPPASMVTRLYRTEPMVARAVMRMTFTAPTSIV
jgi:hypothetical protein